MKPNIGAVVLAAGRGTRLNCTDLPKVMKEIGRRPMVSYIVETLRSFEFSPDRIMLVIGFRKERVMGYFGDSVSYAHQEEQKGTAHAAYVGMLALPKDVAHVLVLGGDDSAFYTPETLRRFVEAHIGNRMVLSLLTAEVENPGGLGRIVRHDTGDVEVIEKEYLTDEQKRIREISTGTFCFDRAWFEEMYPAMPPLRKLGEYGLPTAVAMARNAKLPHQFVRLDDPTEWFGVNTPEELAIADMRKRTMNKEL